MKIFISYGRKDALDFAIELSNWLRQQGYDPWLDIENGIPVGAPFDIRIELGISGSKILIAILSPWSLRPDGFCRNELLYAQACKKPIIPIRIANVNPPIQIISLNFIDVFDNPQTLFEKLPLVIEEISKTGKSILREWPNLDTENPWWVKFKKLDFQEELACFGKSFIGRDWLFKEIEKWIAQSKTRLLFITGSPGIGKSAIAAQMTARLNIKGVHFCSRSNPPSCRFSSWLCGLIFQLAAQFLPYREQINHLDDPNWGDPAGALFRKYISDPLRNCQDKLEITEPWIFVIDSLDESVAEDGPKLADLLADSSDRIPDWIRIIVLSRPDQHLTAKFKIPGIQQYSLKTDDERNLEDLSSYVSNQFQLMLAEKIIPDIPDAVNKLSEHSGGNFLYVKITLNALNDSDPNKRLGLDEIGKLPNDLTGLYQQMFKNRFKRESVYREEVRPLLDCLIASEGPLPKEILVNACGLEQNTAQKSITILSQFLNQTEKDLKVFHQSLADWLSNEQESTNFAVSLESGHKKLANFCFSEFKSGLGKMSTYSMANLHIHLLKSGRWDDLLEVTTNPELNLISRWVEGEEGETGLSCLTSLIEYLEKNNNNLVTSAGLASQVARIYSHWGQYEDAELYLMKALENTSWIRGRRIHVVALHELGSLYLYRGDFNQSARKYTKALRLCLWGKPIYHDEVAGNLIGLGTIYLSKFLFQKTIKVAHKAFKASKKAEDIRHIIASERLIASAYKYLGRYPDATLHIESALLLCDKFKIYLERLRLLLLQGWLQYDLSTLNKGLPGDAPKYFQQAHEGAKKLFNLYCLLEAKIGMAWCALDERETSKAASWLDEIKTLLPLGRHHELRAGFEIGSAAIVQQQGDLLSSLKLYQESISFCDQHNINSWKCRALIGLGAVFLHLGKSKESTKIWNQALETGEKISKAKKTLVQISINLSKTNIFITPR